MVMLLATVLDWLQPTPDETQPAYLIQVETLPVVTAQSWLVFDVLDGTVLASQQADEQVPIASVTKLFTAAAFRDHFDLAATQTVSYADIVTEGRAGKLQVGEVYSARELLFPLLLESSNDAAAVLLREQPELLVYMEELSKELGLAQTTFADTSGLSDGNLSSASDLGVLLRYLQTDQPHILDITRLPDYYSAANGWFNSSPFVGAADYRGGKHGYTFEANRTAAVMFTEQFIGGDRLVGYILLGSDDLQADMAILRSFVRETVSYQ